jgi:hypothetical protein
VIGVLARHREQTFAGRLIPQASDSDGRRRTHAGRFIGQQRRERRAKASALLIGAVRGQSQRPGRLSANFRVLIAGEFRQFAEQRTLSRRQLPERPDGMDASNQRLLAAAR